MRLPHGGRAICFTLILAFAGEHTAKRGCAVGPLHSSWRL